LRAGRTAGSMYYTYVLKSERDNNLYIGWTDDLKSRIIRHQKGLVESTRNRRPLILVYYEACLKKENAIKREKALKSGFGRKYLKTRLSD
jgi:putative endonuclease